MHLKSYQISSSVLQCLGSTWRAMRREAGLRLESDKRLTALRANYERCELVRPPSRHALA